MEKTIFEQMGGTYTQQGDCYLPNLVLPTEKETRPIGVWGQRHLRYLNCLLYTSPSPRDKRQTE